MAKNVAKQGRYADVIIAVSGVFVRAKHGDRFPAGSCPNDGLTGVKRLADVVSCPIRATFLTILLRLLPPPRRLERAPHKNPIDLGHILSSPGDDTEQQHNGAFGVSAILRGTLQQRIKKLL